MKLNVLCIGDIVGRPGRRILAHQLNNLIGTYEIDCVIANAENAAGGSGLTVQIYNKLLRYGVNLITLGDHTYRKREIVTVLDGTDNLARPGNFSKDAAGRGWAVYKTANGVDVGVVCLIGQIFMKPADNPYTCIDNILAKLKSQVEVVFVDFHAEATSEKVAMGYYLDGKVSCVFGTHTHVATADEKIHPGGTAYITDVGMTGAHDSVLGRSTENVLKSFRTQMPHPFEIATGDVRIGAIVVRVDSITKKAEHIKRISVPAEAEETEKYDRDNGKREYYNEFS